ncbi:MAG TPA: PEGA domain-containing protein [Candidatus Acidoferrales bacterium]|nr:PEGA domain-containing protein [Candidatus Acidoferrales bacterium]
MHITRRLLVLILCTAMVAGGQGNTFKRVRYNGGSVASKVDPKDWDNELTVTASSITLKLKDGATLEISPKSVTSLSYGQEAHRRVGTMVALAVLISPVALFGLLHKTRLHYIGIQYSTPENQKAGVLLQGDKDNYRAILVALQGVTSAPVTVGEKDREFVPAGTTTTLVKEGEATNPAGQTAPNQGSQSSMSGTVAVTSVPDGADVYSDGAFVGNCPASLKLSAGKHTIRVSMNGFKDWTRELTVQDGSEVKLAANLEKQN